MKHIRSRRLILFANQSRTEVHFPLQNRISFDNENREVRLIRKYAPINLIVHYPTTPEGKEELARRVASVHADAVIYRIQNLKCPTKQKLELLDAVIKTVKERSREQER